MVAISLRVIQQAELSLSLIMYEVVSVCQMRLVATTTKIFPHPISKSTQMSLFLYLPMRVRAYYFCPIASFANNATRHTDSDLKNQNNHI